VGGDIIYTRKGYYRVVKARGRPLFIWTKKPTGDTPITLDEWLRTEPWTYPPIQHRGRRLRWMRRKAWVKEKQQWRNG
jgi:hypothetical protein